MPTGIPEVQWRMCVCVGGRGSVVRRKRQQSSCCPNALADEDFDMINSWKGKEAHRVN